MYELPDLLVVARQMNDELQGKKIVAAQFNEKGYYNLPEDAFEAALIGKTIGPSGAQGKWLLVRLEPDMYFHWPKAIFPKRVTFFNG